MNKSIEFQGKELHYLVEGSGDALLFLHGYLESREIWDGFLTEFSDKYMVITPDIPGHGKSGIFGEVHSMAHMAELIQKIVKHEGVNKVFVIGHSMGGYVAMEYLHKFPDLTSGLCLLHSTCFADSEEKKLNRDREISLVQCGKKMQIIRTNIPKAFADDNIDKLKVEVERAKVIAASSADDGVVSLLKGMKERVDHTETLQKSKVPILLVWGRKDNYISEEVITNLRVLAPMTETLVLDHSGHMSFIEEPSELYSGLSDFISKAIF